MTVLISPALFPPSISYHFAGDGAVPRHMAQLLNLLCPSSLCTGFGDPGGAAAEDFIVLCDSDQAEIRARWNAEKGNEDRLIVLPVPIDDPWSYWAFSLNTINELSFDGEVKMAEDDFTNFLINKADRGQFDESGNLQLYRDSYLSLHDELADEDKARIRIVEDGLADAASRALYRMVLEGTPQSLWRHYLSTVFSSVQYFDFIGYSRCHTVLNGGIWLGSEMPLLLALLPDDAVIHNIDPCGHDHLSPYVFPSVRRFRRRCIEHRVALSDHRGNIELEMMPDGQASSTTDTPAGQAENSFPCLTIDDLVSDNKLSQVDLIKFDLEGGETSALAGMQQTVRRHRPQLAISIYHRKSDYWELPITLMTMCENYNFHLGHYSYERFETVLYCIPKEISELSIVSP